MKKEVNLGIILNYIVIGLTNLSSLLVTPVLLKGMGDYTYGLYTLVFQIFLIFAVFDFGIGIYTIKCVAEYRVQNDDKGLSKFVFHIFWVYMGFSATVFVIFMLINLFSPLMMDKPEDAELFRHMFGIMAINCALMFFQNMMASIISGFEKFIFTRVLYIVKFSLRIVGLLSLSYVNFAPQYACYVDLYLTIGCIIMLVIYMFRLKIDLKPVAIDYNLMKKSVISSFFLYIIPITENLYWNVSLIIIVKLLDPSAVTKFSIGIVFCNIITQFAATLSSFKLPEVSALYKKQGNSSDYNKYLLDVGRIQSILIGGIVPAFLILGQLFLKLWVGEDFDISYYVALITMTACLCPLTQSIMEMALYADDKYSTRTFILLSATTVNTVMMWFGVKWFGLPGAAMVLAITTIIFKYAVMNLYYKKTGMCIGRFNKEITFKIIPAVIVAGAVGAVGLRLAPYTEVSSIADVTFPLFSASVLNVICTGAAYSVMLYFTYITKEQKKALKEYVRSKLLIFRKPS